jgi:hypothetical protein
MAERTDSVMIKKFQADNHHSGIGDHFSGPAEQPSGPFQRR